MFDCDQQVGQLLLDFDHREGRLLLERVCVKTICRIVKRKSRRKFEALVNWMLNWPILRSRAHVVEGLSRGPL